MFRRQRFWVLAMAIIIAAGMASRVFHSGWRIVDKYLGDALYAAMGFAMISLFGVAGVFRRALLAMAVMTALELFQLTGIPATMLRTGTLPVRVIARLLGTEFSFRDLLAYAVGIAAICLVEKLRVSTSSARIYLL
jgi:hypothetical protein